jgi:hypothetical protein
MDIEAVIKRGGIAILASLTLAAALGAQDKEQEPKPVPKNSRRVAVVGCTRGHVFTVIPRTEDQGGSADVPVGMHLRMNGDKKLMKEIEAREGSVIVLTGLMKVGQPGPGGVKVGGVRVGPGPSQGGGNGIGVSASPQQDFIDVEGWRPGRGECP